MKKVLLKSTMVIAVALGVSCAYALELNQLTSTLSGKNLKKALHPPTDVTIINASGDIIFTVVPNSPVNDLLNREVNNHIHSYDPNIWSIYLVLQDPYRHTFYAREVCNHAIVTAYGYPGNYRINYDADLCMN